MSLAVMLLKHYQKQRVKAVHEIITSLDGVNVCEINITYDNSENSPLFS